MTRSPADAGIWRRAGTASICRIAGSAAVHRRARTDAFAYPLWHRITPARPRCNVRSVTGFQDIVSRRTTQPLPKRILHAMRLRPSVMGWVLGTTRGASAADSTPPVWGAIQVVQTLFGGNCFRDEVPLCDRAPELAQLLPAFGPSGRYSDVQMARHRGDGGDNGSARTFALGVPKECGWRSENANVLLHTRELSESPSGRSGQLESSLRAGGPDLGRTRTRSRYTPHLRLPAHRYMARIGQSVHTNVDEDALTRRLVSRPRAETGGSPGATR